MKQVTLEEKEENEKSDALYKSMCKVTHNNEDEEISEEEKYKTDNKQVLKIGQIIALCGQFCILDYLIIMVI